LNFYRKRTKDLSKILIVVDSIDIEDSSGSKANVAIIKNLVETGFEVSVYHYTLKDVTIEGAICVEIPEIKFSICYFLSRIQRVLSRNFNIEISRKLENVFGFSFTFFNDTASIIRALKKQKFNPDLVVTLSKGASFRPHYALLKLPELHDKWMAYVHDPYPFYYYPEPYNWSEPGYVKKVLFFRNVSEKAKFSAFPSKMLLEWMGNYFPEFLKKAVVIPHQSYYYESKQTNISDYMDIRRFNVLHAGNLMKQRSPEGLIQGFNLFLKDISEAVNDAKLLLLGPASYHSEMLSYYQSISPNLLVINKSISFDEVYNLQKKVSVNVILESKSEISPFLPAKFPHCVEANKMIMLLSPSHSETRRLLGDTYEFWSEVDDVQKIVQLIKKLYFQWKTNPQSLDLDREDLKRYLSADFLKEVISKCL
jgi:hypothetical protein